MTGPTISGNLLAAVGAAGAAAEVSVKPYRSIDAAVYGTDARVGTYTRQVPTSGQLTIELPAEGWWVVRIDPVRRGNQSFQRLQITANIVADTSWGELIELVTDPVPDIVEGRSLDDRVAELVADPDSDVAAALADFSGGGISLVEDPPGSGLYPVLPSSGLVEDPPGSGLYPIGA